MSRRHLQVLTRISYFGALSDPSDLKDPGTGISLSKRFAFPVKLLVAFDTTDLFCYYFDLHQGLFDLLSVQVNTFAILLTWDKLDDSNDFLTTYT